MCLYVGVCVYVYIHIHIYIYIYCFYLGQRQSQPSALINYLSLSLLCIMSKDLRDIFFSSHYVDIHTYNTKRTYCGMLHIVYIISPDLPFPV